MNDEIERIQKYQPLLKSLYETCKGKLGFKPDVKVVILKDDVNSDNPIGKTAYYDPSQHKVGLYTQGRHIKDIMRSFSHELVHHSQNCRGDFAGGLATVDGYAQEDGQLREMEREAYETGNLLFRDWEDNLKKNDNNKLFTGTSVMGEKLMENKDSELREVIRGIVKEILISIKEEDVEEVPEATEEVPVELAEEKPADLTEEEDDDAEEEEIEESFFPTTHDIRSEARNRTNKALMERWGYAKKGK